jgi:PAS domain S-box-containing protein
MTFNNASLQKRILIIDDNQQIHQDFKKILHDVRDDNDLDKLEEVLLGGADNQLHETYHIDCAFQGEEGLKMVEESLRKNEPYAVAFVDVRMPPGWDGIETVSRIWKLYPEIQIVICTAYSDYSWEEMVEKLEHSDKLLILKKPFDNIEVRQLTHALSKKWELGRIASIKMSELERKVEERTKELNKTKSQLEAILNTSPVHIASINKSGKYASWNKASEDMFGYKADEVIGKLTPAKLHRSEEEAKLVIDTVIKERIFKDEVFLVRRDGSEFPAQLLVSKTIDSSGNHIGFTGVAIDITERKGAEEALRESEEKYRTMIEHSNDMIWTLDEKGDFIYFNKKSEELTGYKIKNEAGDSFVPIILEDDLKMVERVFIETLQGKSQSYEVRIHDSEKKRIITLSVNTAPIFKDKKIVGTVSFGRDITKQKRAEEALAAEKERLLVTLRSIGDGVITADIKGNVVLMNKVAEELTGWKQDETIGKPLNEVFHIINEETRKSCENPYEKVLKTGKVIELANNTVLMAKDGTERIIADSGAPIRDKDSKIIGIVLVFRDITEKRRMQEEILNAQKLESVGILAGGIAHDFNNILTAILGNISIARINAKPGDKSFERLTEAEAACTRAKNLTQQLLTFSKGGTPIKKAASISKLLKDSTSFALTGSNVKGKFCLPDDLWDVEIDEDQISQVINNLVINANQAMPDGGIIKLKAQNIIVNKKDNLPLKKDNYVKITIKDQGIGISGEHLHKIFDPYFTTKQKGSGLGLAITYSIITKHNGHIAVESKVGVGTTFHIYLPASEKKAQLDEVKRRPKIITGQGKILVMDDEKVVRDVAGEMLRHIGYEVHFAEGGAKAIKMYKKAKEAGNPFDAVILDLTIPGGIGGEEAIKTLTKIDSKAKVIVSSGYSNDLIMANYKEYGFAGVVSKPYKVQELSELLHKVISGVNKLE